MRAFIDYINKHFADHSHLEITHQVLESLSYIEKNIDEVVSHVNKELLFRHPKSPLAINLHAYSTKEKAKEDLLQLVNTVRTCVQELLKIADQYIKQNVIAGFIQNINDSDVGCMEIRLRDAITYYSLYESTGCEKLDDLMFKFFNFVNYNKIPSIENMLDFFSEKINHHLSVIDKKGEVKPLTWQMVKNYCKYILGLDEIEESWQAYGKALQHDLVTVEETHRTTTWHRYYFQDAASANRCLSYIKSTLPPSFNSTIAKASIKETDQGKQKIYHFMLTQAQHDKFNTYLKRENILEHESKAKGKGKKPEIEIEGKGKEKVTEKTSDKGKSPAMSNKVWQWPIVADWISEIAKKKTIYWKKEINRFQASYPKIWENRAFILGQHFTSKVIQRPKNTYFYQVGNKNDALQYLIFIKLLLINQYDELKNFKIQQRMDGTFGFTLNGQVHLELEKMRMSDSLAKVIRWDEHCFLEPFLLGITKTEKNQYVPIGKDILRPFPHKKFTIYGYGIYPRLKRISPYTQAPYFLDEEKIKRKKLKTSKHQSTSLITFKSQNPLFGHDRERRKKLVFFNFDLKKALVNRAFRYDGGTVKRKGYEFFDEASARARFKKSVLSDEPILIHDIEKFKESISKHKRDYNEVLARIRFDINSTSIGIGSDTFEARCIAQHYAEETHKRVAEQFKEMGLRLDEKYKVPITYYLPGNIKNNMVYTEAAQLADRKLANDIVQDPERRKKAFAEKNYEFLLLVSNPGIIFKNHKETPLLLEIMIKESSNLAKRLYKRTSLSKEKDFTAYLADLMQPPKIQSIIKADPKTILPAILTSKSSDLLFPAIKPYLNATNINKFYKDGLSLFSIAVQQQDVNMIKELCKLGANVNIENKAGKSFNISGLSPLHVAIQTKNIEVIGTLLEQGANPNYMRDYKNMLTWAIKLTDNLDIIKLLIKYGANPKLKGEIMGAESVLETAMLKQRPDIIHYLLLTCPSLIDKKYGIKSFGGNEFENKIKKNPLNFETIKTIIIPMLIKYINEMQSRKKEYRHTIFKGFSKTDKLKVAQKLLTSLNCDKKPSVNALDLPLLENGNLGKIFSSIKAYVTINKTPVEEKLFSIMFSK